VIASTLLGTHPPALRPVHLVRVGELFGIAEGTTRVALSRMVGAGELVVDDGRYHLTGPLLERQARQEASRSADPGPWDGTWDVRVVVGDARTADDRAALRAAARALGLAERREGVWTRPANLADGRAPGAEAVVDGQTERWSARPAGDAAALAASLWDLDGWRADAEALRAAMGGVVDRLEAGDADALASGFVLAAAVLRHLLADPRLPAELVPADWPGPALRHEYDRYDVAFRAVLSTWLRADGAR
jgi:phenylacetic acid degradation operon negative regulatory protein